MSQTRALRDLLASGQEMGSRSASPVRDDLVGRARELEQIAGLLALRRLVTVAGAGGMGVLHRALDLIGTLRIKRRGFAALIFGINLLRQITEIERDLRLRDGLICSMARSRGSGLTRLKCLRGWCHHV